MVSAKEVLSVLTEAKRLLNAHPKAWIKWHGFGDGVYEPTGPYDHTPQSRMEEARSFCALGASVKAAGGYTMAFSAARSKLATAAIEVAKQLGRPMESRGSSHERHVAAQFNNTSDSVEEVNKMFCHAINEVVNAVAKEEHNID